MTTLTLSDPIGFEMGKPLAPVGRAPRVDDGHLYFGPWFARREVMFAWENGTTIRCWIEPDKEFNTRALRIYAQQSESIFANLIALQVTTFANDDEHTAVSQTWMRR